MIFVICKSPQNRGYNLLTDEQR